MEDEDCSVDEEGKIDVRYRGWTEIDTSIYNFYEQVMSLDLSFNQLQCIPEEIGKLNRMTTLNCENNAIERLPESMGKLRALKVLKLSKNNLTNLPESIGKCRKMTMLHLDNNRIEFLPPSIGNCLNLQVLKLQHNGLKDLPITLAQLKETLQDIDVSNNPDLAIIPKGVQGQSSVIMWIIGFRHDKTMELKTIRQAIRATGDVMKKNEEWISVMNNEIEELQKKKSGLLAEREGIWLFLQMRDFRRQLQFKTKYLIHQCKELFDRSGTKIAAS